MVGEPDELEPLVELDAGRPERSTPMRTAIAQSSPTASRTDLEHLEPEARAVLERAAVLVGALVVERRQELGQQVAVAAVDVDDVEAGLARPLAPRTQSSADARGCPQCSIAFGTMNGS